MTSPELANPPAEAGTLAVIDTGQLERLMTTLADLADRMSGRDELCLYTPEEAADLLKKTANWVTEAIQNGRIPYTRVGQSPRLTADHIRQIAASGEVRPHKYAKPANKPARAAA